MNRSSLFSLVSVVNWHNLILLVLGAAFQSLVWLEHSLSAILLVWLSPQIPCLPGVPQGQWGGWGGSQLSSLGLRPRALARLVSHSLCSLGPITGGAWQGNEEEVSATAGSECSSVVGKFEEQPGWGEQDLTDKVQSEAGLFHINFLNNHSSPSQGGPAQLPLAPTPAAPVLCECGRTQIIVFNSKWIKSRKCGVGSFSVTML